MLSVVVEDCGAPIGCTLCISSVFPWWWCEHFRYSIWPRRPCLNPSKGHAVFTVHLWHSSMNVCSNYYFCCQKMNNTSFFLFTRFRFTISLLTTQRTIFDNRRMLLLAFSHLTCTRGPLVAVNFRTLVGTALCYTCKHCLPYLIYFHLSHLLNV